MASDWDEYSEEHGQFYDESVPPLLVKYLSSPDRRVFLDVGCGEGILLHSLRSKGLLRDKRVLAVDISEKRVAAVRRIDPSCECGVDDACRLSSVADSSVDILASLQVIEHVPNDNDMILQIHRVLSRHGIAYVTTVFKNPRAWYLYKNASGETVIDPTHVREYRDDKLLGAFSSNGFEIVEERKEQILKPVLGFYLLGRLGADPRILLRHPLLRFLRRIRYPVPGYFYWEIVARKI